MLGLWDKDAIFTLSCFFLTVSISHGTLCLVLGLVGIRSTAAASMWALKKFSYSSLGVCVLDIFWRVSNLFLTVTVYLLLISLLVKWGLVVANGFDCFYLISA